MSQQLPENYNPFAPMRDEMPEHPPAPPARKRSGAPAVVLTLAVLLAAAILVNESLLRIRTVTVVGNSRVSWEDIVVAAGLRGSVSYFSLNEKKIAEGVNQNRYLIFERMEKQFPDTVTLYVRERTPRTSVQVMGATYQLDEEGMILERISGVRTSDELMNVTGFQTREVRLGSVIVASRAEQMEAYRTLVQEVLQQGFSDQVSELNLSDPDSLYLITKDGYTAHLGDRTEMRAKIGTVRAVVAKLREMNKRGGMLEASKPGAATYMPMDDPLNH